MNTKDKLAGLENLMYHKENLESEMKTLLDQVITPEIRMQMDDIKAEFSPKIEEVDRAIETLTAQVKTDVIAGGKTIGTEHLQAVYTNPRVSWDSKVLDTMVEFYPKIAAARKVGQASVSIRKK